VTIHARVAAARQRLRDAGIPSDEADLDARLLAEYVLGWTTERYFVDANLEEPDGFAARYEPLVTRRASREPYAYIVGREEFWGLDFEITPAVLIPRPETELIVEIALELFPHRDAAFRVCDIGTGSGCIGVAIAHERPHATITAIDISPSALAVARRNAERHGVASRVEWRGGDLFAGAHDAWDLVVSNPPYVADRDRPTIQAEVGQYEPAQALFAGADGLDTIRRLVATAPGHLRPDGYFVFEFGFGQADAVVELLATAAGLRLVAIRPDLQGIERAALTQKVKS
jgi:release factor glutamine methyltransferase